MGIKGYEGKKNKCREQGRKLSKKEWYRGEKKIDYCGKKSRRNGNKTDGKSNVKARAEQKSVLFVEQTREGELSRRLRDLMQRLAPIMGFSIKIVERSGGAIKNRFPQAGLWEGMKCGRESCITCNQGAEFLVPCT